MNTVLNNALMEDYWYLIRDIWKEMHEEYGYLPLPVMFHVRETSEDEKTIFETKWLERVRRN